MGCYSNDTILTGIGTKGDPVGYRTVEIKNAVYENRLTPTLKSRKNKFFLLGLLVRSIYSLFPLEMTKGVSEDSQLIRRRLKVIRRACRRNGQTTPEDDK